MKVRFYCDIPSTGARLSGPGPHWCLGAYTQPGSAVMKGYTRVAFDVDLPPELVVPPHDVLAPAGVAMVVEKAE